LVRRLSVCRQRPPMPKTSTIRITRVIIDTTAVIIVIAKTT